MGFEPSRTRTCDPLVKSQLLYRLSYRPIYMQKARKSGILHEKYLATKRHIRHKTKSKKFCALCAFLWLIPEPATERGIVHDDRLHAFGAGGDEADFGADLL